MPVGGSCTMNAAEAARAVRRLRPRIAVPDHRGDIVGTRVDAEAFAAAAADTDMHVLAPGDSTDIP